MRIGLQEPSCWLDRWRLGMGLGNLLSFWRWALYTEKKILAGFGHVGLCDVAQYLLRPTFSSGCAESRRHAFLDEDNRDSPVRLKSRSPLWDDLRRAQSHRGGSDLSPLPVILAPV